MRSGHCPQLSSCLLPSPSKKNTQLLLGLSTEPRTHLVEHVLKVQLQVAEQAGRQGKAGQGVGQAGL